MKQLTYYSYSSLFLAILLILLFHFRTTLGENFSMYHIILALLFTLIGAGFVFLVLRKKNYSSHLDVASENLLSHTVSMEELIALSPDCHCLYNLSTHRYEYISEGISRVLGYTPNDILEMDEIALSTLFHPDEYELHKSIKSTVIPQSNTPVRAQYRMKHNDGSWRWVESIELIYPQGGQDTPLVIYKILHDIHQAKCAEIELSKTAELLHQQVKNLPVGVVVYSDNHTISLSNDFALRLFGSLSDDAEWSFVHSNGTPCEETEYPHVQSFQTLEPIRDLVLGIVRPERKNPTWVLINSFPKLDTQGKITQLILTYANITHVKSAETELAAEKERLAVTLRSIGDGVITTDIFGRIMMLNQSAEQLTGWSSDQAMRKPLSEVFNTINEETRKPCPNPVDTVLETGAITEHSTHSCLVSKDGKKILISDNAAPIFDTQGKMVGAVLVFRDITQKEKLTDSLQKSQKLDSLGVLAGGIAHDFNNLLGGIFGYLDIALVQKDTEKASQYIRKALGTIERARELTQQLLTFSKGGDPVKKVAPLFPFVQNRAIFALSGSNVGISFDVHENLDHCHYDENQISQVIDNIIINAQESMPEGGTIDVSANNVTIGVKKHPELSAGQYVKISIVDKGPGIPKEILPSIFDPFFTTKENGKGLGLATSYSIINRHGGCIEVSSEVDKGTTFNIYLPSVGKSEPQKRSEEVIYENIEKGTILVMEDEDFMQEIIESMLTMLGYDVVLKGNGQDALEFYKKSIKENRPIVAMIFDLTIPGGMGGKETIQEIRKLNKEIPVFVASGYAQDPIMADPERYGFNDSITKPFRLDSLTNMIKKHLKKRK